MSAAPAALTTSGKSVSSCSPEASVRWNWSFMNGCTNCARAGTRSSPPWLQILKHSDVSRSRSVANPTRQERKGHSKPSHRATRQRTAKP